MEFSAFRDGKRIRPGVPVCRYDRLGLLSTTSLFSLALALAFGSGTTHAQTLPSGGQVTHGEASVSRSGSNLLIHQKSPNAILSWDSFSIGGGASAHFDNGVGATLNRVTGNLPSSIDGMLTATGSVYLVNSAGIAVGSGGMVRTGGSFVASTLDVSDGDFLAGGNMVFSGTSKAGVVNEGMIVSLGGDVVLTARRVENSGTILASQGDVGLLAGYEVLLRDLASEDGKFAVRVGGADTEVVNTGRIEAANVELRANGGNVYALAGNTDGVVKATGMKRQGGRIFLTAGEGGTVKATQRIVARSAPQRQVALPDRVSVPQERPADAGVVQVAADRIILGGEIDVSAAGMRGGTIIAIADERLEVTSGAALDASGADGGLILLGGDYQGGANERNNYWHEALGTTQTTLVAEGATIGADGASGAGGSVVIWGDGHTGFAGSISATGVTRGGDAEVSGKATLAYGGTADLRASDGAFGTLLLDPYNITIAAGAGGMVKGGGFTATGDNSILGADTLLAALDYANVTVQTGTGGSQAGSITVNADLAWLTNATLTLQAAGGIVLNNAITARAGGLTLDAGGTITTGANGAVEVARFTLQNGDWVQNAATLPAFSTGDFRITGGSFLRAQGGSGTNGDPFVLTDIYGVQGISNRLTRSFALANDIDASGTRHWWDGAGFMPIGRLTDSSSFSGSFDGRGHVISGLVVDRPNRIEVGLFGYTADATITNVGIEGASVTGSSAVGGLVGWQGRGTITQSWVTGAVNGDSIVGGLVGAQNGGAITLSWADSEVVNRGSYAGGLVGFAQNNGTISQSWASGSVKGSSTNVGGLVGYQNSGTITQSWASGSVEGNANVGGLVGAQHGTVSASYWDIGTTGQSQGRAGGIGTFNATGLTTDEFRNISADQNTWLVTRAAADGWDFDNVWYQRLDMRPILRSGAGPVVGGVTQISSLMQLQLMGANLAGSYALTRDIDASATDAGHADYDPSGIWGPGGFVPVGSWGAPNSFSGTFDGQGHVISGLTIARPAESYASLFGRTQNATIANVGLEGVSVSGNRYVGGLVGALSNSQITRSWANGVVGGNFEVGGLAGYQVLGLISQSWASGTVSGDSTVGGLIGYQASGTTSQSWASVAVSGNSWVGGLVGVLGSGTLEHSWASGAVSGNIEIGGLVGFWNAGVVTSSYWDRDSAGPAVTRTIGNIDGNDGGLFTGAARSRGSYVGWDFDTVWYHDGDLRPIHRWMAAPVVDGVAQVSNILQLQMMGMNLAGSYVLTRDIDASAANGSNPSGIWSSSGFSPVGRMGAEFTGDFDGQGHVISGLTIDRPNQNYVGLFGNVQGATISKVGLENVSVVGASYVGGLVGELRSGSISQSGVSGQVTATQTNAGGLVGRLDGGSIGYSWADASIQAVDIAGQLLGYVLGIPIAPTTIHDSWSDGEVTGTGPDVGGMVGLTEGTAVNVMRSYYNGQTDRFRPPGIGLTDAEFYDPSSFGNWDFTGIWAPPSLGHRPSLYALERVIRVDASHQRVYGETSEVARYHGLRPGEFLTAAATLSGLPAANANVGSYSVSADVSAAAATAGYRFVTLGGSVSVTPRAITVTADDLSRIYGSANPSLTFSVGGMGLANGDTLSGSLATTATLTSNVGGYAVTQGTLAASSNYALSFDAGTLSVTPRTITVTALGGTSIYGDGGLNPGFTATNLANGEGVDVLTGLSSSFGITAGTDAGSYTLSVLGALTNGNYQIAQRDAGTWVVTPRAITVTADDLSRIYGNANPSLTFSVGGMGLANGDTLSGSLATTATLTSNVGGYAVTQGTLAASSNYALSFDAGTLSVTPRTITVTALDGMSIYGDGGLNPGFTATNLANGEGVDVLTGLSSSFGITAGTDAGSYTLSVLGALTNGNYQIGQRDAGTWVVTPRAITVTALGGTSIYGDGGLNPGFTATNLANGEGVDVLTGLSSSFGITAGTDAGTYTLGVLGALTNGNYQIAQRDTGTWVVTPRAITVTADDLDKVLGAVEPALTWTVGGDGLAGGDTIGGVFTGGLLRDSGELPGSYAIGQGTLTANGNYAVTFRPGTFTILPAGFTPSLVVERSSVPDIRHWFAQEQGEAGRLGLCEVGVLIEDACSSYTHPANREMSYVGFAR